MKIGELAKKTGCKVVTIRYYEQEGLLGRPERSGANYRLYSAEDLARLEFIMHCRKHDMKLEEIKKLLAFRDNPQRDCSWVGELVDRHLAGVEAQIRSLEHLKEHLEALRRSCAGEHSGTGCGIIRSLNHKESCCEHCSKCGQGCA